MKRFDPKYLSALSNEVYDKLLEGGYRGEIYPQFVEDDEHTGVILIVGAEPFAEILDEVLIFDTGMLSQTKLWNIADAMSGLASKEQYNKLDFKEDGYVYEHHDDGDIVKLRTDDDVNMTNKFNVRLNLVDIKNILSIMNVQHGLLSNENVDAYMNEYDRLTKPDLMKLGD